MVLQNYIRQLIDMPLSKANEIADHFNQEKLTKGAQFLTPGQISRKTYFLAEGFTRSYIIDIEGVEVTTRLYGPPILFNDFLSFFRKEPSKEYYQAITDCNVWTIDFENLQKCFHTIPEFREAGRMMLTLNYATLHNHTLSFHTQTAEERYLNLVSFRPEIIQNVPLKIIASYLGITDTSLSRIRKNLTE